MINLKDRFTKWITDNFDHNIMTLCDKSPFPGIGIIETSMLNKEHPNLRIKLIPKSMGKSLERFSNLCLYR